jgi:polar amino acid transport system ATP-binding protein
LAAVQGERAECHISGVEVMMNSSSDKSAERRSAADTGPGGVSLSAQGAPTAVAAKPSQAPEPVVVGRGMCKKFGDRAVMRDVDFEVAPGEMLVVMGKSGSGKSTLLRILAGLTHMDSGELHVEGTPVMKDGEHLEAWKEKRRLIGMVFQQYTLWPHMSVYKNLALGPQKVLKQGKNEITRRAEKALTEVGMIDHIHSRPSSLSGGERQRVAIARALMMQPRIILCDEITSALDPPIAAGILGLLSTLKREEGIGCVIVTHDMAFASKAADRVIFVEDGRVVEQEEPSVAFHNPSSPGLRAFVEALRVE